MIRIVLTGDGAHLAVGDETTALCLVSVGGRPRVALEPGAEFGELSGDCRKCLTAWRNMSREARR